MRAWAREQRCDLSHVYERESICIGDYVSSLAHDVRLVRESLGTPAHVDVHGYVYDIDTGALHAVVEDRGTGGSEAEHDACAVVQASR